MGSLVEIEHLTVSFESKRRISFLHRSPPLKALDDVSLTIGERETFGLTGETGSGKSTLAKVLVALYRPTSGTVKILGRKIDYKNRKDVTFLRQNVGIVFQDPVRSLNPSLTVKEVVIEALLAAKSIPKKDYDERIDFITQLVGVTKDLLPRRPRELSGGQRQRISLARALVVPKKLLILDEPTSALDVSIQAQVLNTLKKLKSELDMSYLFITHDINVIKYVSHRLGVLFYGKLVEIGDTRTIDTEPKHPYTQNLISHVLTLKKAKLQETVVSEHRPASSGCRYRIVCPSAFERCGEAPPLVDFGAGHLVSCFLYDHGPSNLVQVTLPTKVTPREGDLQIPPHDSS
jgi:oligopeptide/dipeptide ABC transporter ATP-binding protein